MEEKFKWHFFNLYCMALSDNEFDMAERELLYKIGLEHDISAEMINEAVLTANLTPVVPTSLEDKVTCLYDLARMAWADGKIAIEEKELMKKYVVLFGFDSNNADQIVEYLLTQVHNGKTIDNTIEEITK